MDLDLESDFSGEIDYYPGECLLREKFSDEVEMERYDRENLNKVSLLIRNRLSFLFKKIPTNLLLLTIHAKTVHWFQECSLNI